jgi:hypothetical protein
MNREQLQLAMEVYKNASVMVVIIRRKRLPGFAFKPKRSGVENAVAKKELTTFVT